MDYTTLCNLVTTKQKGTFSRMVWQKELPVRAAYKGQYKVTKVTQGTVRFGVNYDAMGAVKAKRATGELPEVNRGLPWGRWKMYPYTITHKGRDYIRVALDKNNKLTSAYFINGQPATKEQVMNICTKAAFSDGSTPDILTICTENVISIR